MLFYLVKHSLPYPTNATRERTKANDGTNLAAYKELLHVIKYVINTKNLGLKDQTHREFQQTLGGHLFQ